MLRLEWALKECYSFLYGTLIHFPALSHRHVFTYFLIYYSTNPYIKDLTVALLLLWKYIFIPAGNKHFCAFSFVGYTNWYLFKYCFFWVLDETHTLRFLLSYLSTCIHIWLFVDLRSLHSLFSSEECFVLYHCFFVISCWVQILSS